MRDLGYINGFYKYTVKVNGVWTEYISPENQEKMDLILFCWEQKHVAKCVEIGSCNREYTCDICQIQYRVDSSD